MTPAIPFDPHRFRSAAPHYLAGRPAYAPALIDRVAQVCGLDGEGRLLDLGCGPGVLAIAFARWFNAILAVDPEPEMLEEGRRLAAGLPITFQQGSSQDISPDWGHVRLATIGRAFHWMDRPETARRLDALIEPGGALVLFRIEHLDVPDNAWRTEFQATIDAAVGNGRPAWRQPGWVKNEAILLDSPFCALERIGCVERVQVSAASLIDRALSMSNTTRARLGDGVQRLRESVEALIGRVAVEGRVSEVVESVALIARRPGLGP